MEIELASQMGFCFGVRRAIDLAEEAMVESGPLASLGAIVHNRQVVSKLACQGMHIIDNVQSTNGNAILIPSHGVSPHTLSQMIDLNLKVIDATCPIVRNAQRVAQELRQEGFDVIVFGDATHPEVDGLLAWAGSNAIAILDVANFTSSGRRIGILSQTTQSQTQFAGFLAQLMNSRLNSLSEIRVFNTICEATSKRQVAALELAQKVDLMLVIGGHDSANTRHLAEICASTGVKTLHIETADELDPHLHPTPKRTGITAGASTPDWVIKEVLQELKRRG